ncbi:TMAO reductase system periplasmic protein TorT [Tepidicaulis marinus]|uniref:TMAO reductase system periplasmic protein TorT n=1 Tax=Tepidicaulis marinus TaxID=1333998 RepID=A0A081BF35_9HYPH|nr:hypothetical protein [Tepidicaulis marinus]GAK46653.1 TMAO reductase system periplasmic protein TorT [Tepidicaulis marinus]
MQHRFWIIGVVMAMALSACGDSSEEAGKGALSSDKVMLKVAENGEQIALAENWYQDCDFDEARRDELTNWVKFSEKDGVLHIRSKTGFGVRNYSVKNIERLEENLLELDVTGTYKNAPVRIKLEDDGRSIQVGPKDDLGDGFLFLRVHQCE